MAFVPIDKKIFRSEDTAALTVSQLSKTFAAAGARKQPVQAVKNVSFSVYPGEVVVLLGANGAGKSTTLACAQGLLKPSGGTISLLGEDPATASPDLKARVGVMLQDGGLPQAIRPIPFLHHLASMYAEPADLDALVDRLKINTFDKSAIRRLSGGQKQRVALAAALLGKPEVLFLDEPSAGLDPQSRQVVFDIIKEQRAAGVAIVLTTHLLDDAQKLADYVYIIDQGQNARQGTVHELASGASKQKTISLEFDSAATFTPPEWLPVTDQENREYSINLYGDFNTAHAARLLQELAKTHPDLQNFSFSSASLEDIYLEISGKDIR